MTVDVTLTAAQLRALDGTPLLLVAAPAAGSFLDAYRADYTFLPGSDQGSSPVTGQNLYLNWGAAYDSSSAMQVVQSSALAAALDTTLENALSSGGAPAAIGGQGLYLVTNGQAVSGNAANDMVLAVTVFYQVVPLPTLESTLASAVVNISGAQLKDLPANPVILVAAPASGRVQPYQVVGHFEPGSDAGIDPLVAPDQNPSITQGATELLPLPSLLDIYTDQVADGDSGSLNLDALTTAVKLTQTGAPLTGNAADDALLTLTTYYRVWA